MWMEPQTEAGPLACTHAFVQTLEEEKTPKNSDVPGTILRRVCSESDSRVSVASLFMKSSEVQWSSIESFFFTAVKLHADWVNAALSPAP